MRWCLGCTFLILSGLMAIFPLSALAQNAPTPSNPSFQTLTKFKYIWIEKNWLQLSATNNGNHSILQIPTTLGQNSVITIPDPGAATANFVLDSGASSAMTIQHVSVPLTSANILAMFATPVQLIAAPAAGMNIVVQKVMFTMTTTSTAYAGGGVVEFQIGNTANGAGTATTATVAAAVVNSGTPGVSYTTVIPVSYTGTAATGLFISNQTAPFTTGTGTAVCDIWYAIK
jgi:hypothetical protein